MAESDLKSYRKIVTNDRIDEFVLHNGKMLHKVTSKDCITYTGLISIASQLDGCEQNLQTYFVKDFCIPSTENGVYLGRSRAHV